MNAIVTVVGDDKIGIIARVCTKLAECSVNILDISQTILQDKFTMVMAVDLDKTPYSIVELSKNLSDLGKEMGLSIRLQREDIFNAMHSI